MNALLLPGNHRANAGWIEELARALQPLFGVSLIYRYKHWDNGASTIDLVYEQEGLRELSEKFSPSIICAKSAGCILALLAIQNGILNPRKLIFIGFPVSWAKEQGIEFRELLKQNALQTLFIQKEFDPVCSAQEIGDLLQATSASSSLCVLPGEDHDYLEIDILKIKIEEFLRKKASM